jgi:hypothetical protein
VADDEPTIHDHLAELRNAAVEHEEADALARRLEAHVDPDQPDDEGVLEEITEAAVRFESSHPAVAAALRKVSDALGGMGI